MADASVLVPLGAIVGLMIAFGVIGRSLLLGASGGYIVLFYVTIRSGNALLQGFTVLTTFFLVMAVGVFFTQTVMGETA